LLIFKLNPSLLLQESGQAEAKSVRKKPILTFTSTSHLNMEKRHRAHLMSAKKKPKKAQCARLVFLRG
jgi:hypothetical protein